MPSAGQQIRIAIALAALRHKPPEQSIQAYLLDLQPAFPAEAAPDAHSECRTPTADPWRDRVLVLEKDIAALQAQYDNDKLELLALRKAARKNQDVSESRSKGKEGKTKGGGARDAIPKDSLQDAPAETSSSSASTAGKKAKGKKTKTKAASPPLSPTVAHLGGMKSLAGIIGGIPTAPTVSAALEVFDAMVDMLPVDDDDALSVPPELISATTTRALRAVASVIDTLVSTCGDRAPRTNGLLITSTNSNSNLKASDPARIVDALNASSRRLVSVSVSALLAYDRAHTASTTTTTTKPSESSKKQKSAVGLPSEPSGAAARAVDDLLGVLYTLVLAPAVRSFSPLSGGFVEACLGVDSISGPRFGPRSPPGTAQNGSTTTSATISPSWLTHPPDLRPSILALVDDALCVLEQVLPATNGSSGTSSDASASAFASASSGSCTPSAASGSGPRSQTQSSCSVFKNAGPDSHAHYQAGVGAGAEAIPSACHVKMLLALECVRELEKLYLPLRMTINRLDACTEPDAGTAGVPDALAGKGNVVPEAERRNTTRDSACGLQETITQSAVVGPHSLPRRIPGLAEVLCQTLGDDSTRPGTVSGSASSSPSPATSQAASRTGHRLEFAGETHRAPGSPRVAGNLGEIAAGSAGSGPGCVPVRDSVRRATAVAEGRRRPGAAGVSDAHAHAGAGDLRGRTQQREKTRARMMVTTRLARKDTVWYLCAVLQRVLPAVALPSGCGCRSHCDAASGSGCGSGLDCDAASPAGTATATATTTATLAGNTVSPLCAPNTPQFAIDTGPGTHTNADTKTAIERATEQAVYDALADLLRRTRRTLSHRTRALASASGFHQPRRPSVYTRPGSSSRPGSGEASNHGRPAPASTSSFAFAAEGRASEAVLSEGLLVSAATGSGESTFTGAETGRTDAGGSGGSAEIGVPRDWRGHMRAGSTTRSAGKGPALQAQRERAREGQEAMGEVERGMLLAVLERTWLGVC